MTLPTLVIQTARQRSLRSTARFRYGFCRALRTHSDADSEQDLSLSYASSREMVRQKAAEMQLKYADKLRKKMEEEGASDLESLKAKVQQETQLHVKGPHWAPLPPKSAAQDSKEQSIARQHSRRTDGSPLKPLEEILNLDKILERPHSTEVIHQLWTAYHSSKDWEGAGLLSATMSTQVYLGMADVAKKYPVFVLPLPRIEAGESGNAWEFYLLQWTFFQSPPEPTPSDNLFTLSVTSRNPRSSTVLFTPLQEFKLNQTFARPYLVLSHYTDLSHSHDIVLLRGEITPSESNPGRQLLSPQDAHMLAMGLQRFYLDVASEIDPQHRARRQLLSDFHEDQANFKWEKLLEIAWKT